jgi:hypothetical protein
MQDVTKPFRLPSLYTYEYSVSHLFISATTLLFDRSFLANRICPGTAYYVHEHGVPEHYRFRGLSRWSQDLRAKKNFRCGGHENRDAFSYQTKDLWFSSALKSKTEVLKLEEF